MLSSGKYRENFTEYIPVQKRLQRLAPTGGSRCVNTRRGGFLFPGQLLI